MNGSPEGIDPRRQQILREEERFARDLSLRVIERPPLSIWMILIPIIFVFWFMRFSRVNEGRKEFVGHYLVIRNRALRAAAAWLEGGEGPNVETLRKESSMPEVVGPEHEALLKVLVEHYRRLLAARGDDFPALVREAYGTRADFLLVLNALNIREKELNRALEAHVEVGAQEAIEVMRSMERHSADLRRMLAEEIFP